MNVLKIVQEARPDVQFAFWGVPQDNLIEKLYEIEMEYRPQRQGDAIIKDISDREQKLRTLSKASQFLIFSAYWSTDEHDETYLELWHTQLEHQLAMARFFHLDEMPVVTICPHETLKDGSHRFLPEHLLDNQLEVLRAIGVCDVAVWVSHKLPSVPKYIDRILYHHHRRTV